MNIARVLNNDDEDGAPDPNANEDPPPQQPPVLLPRQIFSSRSLPPPSLQAGYHPPGFSSFSTNVIQFPLVVSPTPPLANQICPCPDSDAVPKVYYTPNPPGTASVPLLPNHAAISGPVSSGYDPSLSGPLSAPVSASMYRDSQIYRGHHEPLGVQPHGQRSIPPDSRAPIGQDVYHPIPGTVRVEPVTQDVQGPPLILSNWTPMVGPTVKRRRSSESPKPSSYMFVPAEFQRRQHRSKSESKVYPRLNINPDSQVDGVSPGSQNANSSEEDENDNLDEKHETIRYACTTNPPSTAGQNLNSDKRTIFTPVSTTATGVQRPKRSKAKNSTWTIEEDRQLIDLVLNTLPVQDYAEYARILNKRDAQTIRYRWRVILRRARGEIP